MDQDQRQRNNQGRPGMVILQFTQIELGVLDQALMLAQTSLASLGSSVNQQLRAQVPPEPPKAKKGK
jgi:hypothetical protein